MWRSGPRLRRARRRPREPSDEVCEERLLTASGCEQAAAEAASLRASLAAERAAAEALGASLAEEERGFGAGRRLVTAESL